MDNDTADTQKKRTGVSFAIAKKKETKQLDVSKVAEVDTSQQKAETDLILSVEENKITSVIPKEAPKELVIPLIQRNAWQVKRGADTPDQAQAKRPSGSLEEKEQNSHAKKRKKEDGDQVQVGDALEDEAVKEIMKDVSKYNEDWASRDTQDLNMTIPLLMQNKVPDGFETDDRLDVSIRPDEASAADYDEVPIEQFGMAMLRGMGWKETEGIGNTMKKAVQPMEVTVRPKGQGLGADRRRGDDLEKKRMVKRKPGDPAPKEDTEPKGFTKGGAVLVTSGPHKNLYGKIEGVDEDNLRVVVKFALSGQSATVSQFAVQLVSKEDYKKYAKDLGKFSKGHDELKKQAEKKSKSDEIEEKRGDRHRDGDRRSDSRDDRHRDGDGRSGSKDDRRSRHGGPNKDKSDKYSDRDSNRSDKSRRDYEKNGERNAGKHRHSDQDESRGEGSRSHSKDRRREDEGSRGRHGDERREDKRSIRDSQKQRTDHDRSSSKGMESTAAYWLRPALRVRFIDLSYKKGKYYNAKVKVIDVITRDTCTCQTDDGKLLEDIHQSMLETLIPKVDPAYVMVVSGKLTGQLGMVLKRDKVRCIAHVQLLSDRESIIKMDYDTICEYAGNIQDEEDY
ncbi:G-patch domain and KOW motifs-containing protein-like [Diadema antillarum]|uniref:G-patch domain and KOW motifs-containing protein-like n=1 Tax=Diadema antillarum TaxID=105358 RepID=UPI003A84688F